MDAITKFMQANYSDERLVMLLTHAESGKLAYVSCCCFVGLVTADHTLRDQVTEWQLPEFTPHLQEARLLPGAVEAEAAYYRLGQDDEERRERIIPIIRAEIARRESLRLTQAKEVVDCELV